MHIKVLNLKNELLNFNNLLKKYENNVINLYYILDKSFEYWKDAFSSYYYDDFCDKKNRTFGIIEDVKFLRNMYIYIEENYSQFGKEIDFNLNKKNEMIELFKNLTENTIKLADSYNNLNLSFIPDEYNEIIDQKNDTLITKNMLNNIKDKYIDNFNLIENIEKNVLHKASKYSIDIAIIKVNDYINSNKENKNISSVYIGKEDLKSIVESSTMYVEEQKSLLLNFKETYESIKKYYNSDNNRILNSLWLQTIDNMDSLIKYYLNFIDVLNYIISLYDDTVEHYNKSFKALENSTMLTNNIKLEAGDNND